VRFASTPGLFFTVLCLSLKLIFAIGVLLVTGQGWLLQNVCVFLMQMICGRQEQSEILDKPISLIRITFPQINCKAGHTAAYAPNVASFHPVCCCIRQESRVMGFLICDGVYCGRYTNVSKNLLPASTTLKMKAVGPSETPVLPNYTTSHPTKPCHRYSELLGFRTLSIVRYSRN
jgi:hypothetical protein